MIFSGEVALITGGSRGIGAAIAQELARTGARVAVGYRRRHEAAERVVSEIIQDGGDALSIELDVSSSDSVDAAFSQVEDAWGPVEILINNAGLTQDHLLLRMPSSGWSEVLDVNLTGPYRTIQRSLRGMLRARFGVIVNISSVVAQRGNPGQANYSAAKAGLEALTRTLSLELGSRGIRVNAVAPGFIETDMTEAMAGDWKDEISNRAALGRAGRSGEVARAVRFLASADASYITGITLVVDGGLSLGL